MTTPTETQTIEIASGITDSHRHAAATIPTISLPKMLAGLAIHQKITKMDV